MSLFQESQNQVVAKVSSYKTDTYLKMKLSFCSEKHVKSNRIKKARH